MGAACCVAVKDRTIVHGPSSGTLQRHVRYSPSWSFRWDNRGRVAGEETHVNWLHNGDVRNGQVEVKYSHTVETSFASEESSPLVRHRSRWQKSPVSDGNGGNSNFRHTDEAISRNLVEVKNSTESPSVSHPSPVKLSPLSASATESARGSNGASSDSWSIPLSSKLTATRRERWSFDSENSGFSVNKIDRSSGSPPTDLQTCGVCARLLTMRSSWGWTSQKIVSNNELAVVSILTCGHVYHAECLEYTTPEIKMYDPACPVCTYGEKQAVKMSEKALKAELDLKHRKRCSKKHVGGSDCGAEGKGYKRSSSIINKSSYFLKRDLLFGSKSGKSLPENDQLGRRKAFFWARSRKE
ncbi:hypothetical protein AAHA92_21110 [Salvia divinorum]|uniref:RING-type domain-containing protein n=1 Tax=Salvia divinorum TaxID=28513 RepID=A0ABD1GJE2_SALDI